MPSDNVLRSLLERPFGPYLDETVLSDKCRFVPSKPLLLENFMLAHNDEPTGFDHIEFDGDFVPSNVMHLAPIQNGSPVLFRGVLSILALGHLSERGIQYLSHDFQERVTRSTMNGVQSTRQYQSFDLEALFALKSKQKDVPEAEQLKIKVIIQGYMHSMASFMRSDLAPNGLLIHTRNANKDRFRNYQVVSMDVETYKLSKTFLFRHHTLRTLRDILVSHGHGVPVYKRTPEWFIDHYLLGIAYPPHSKWCRINSLEDVESSDEDSGNNQGQISIPRPDDAQTHRPRRLRTVHRNEVWSIFASHSEWIFSLIQTHKDLKGKVDAPAWGIFFMQIPQLRQKALLDEDTDGKWGLKDEQNGGYQNRKATTLSIPLSIPKYKPDAQPRTSKGTLKGHKRKSPSTHPVIPTKPSTTVTASSSKAPTTVSSEEHLNNIYDSDFSQASLSPTSFHAGSALPNAATINSPPDPELYTLIPPEMLTPPTLPVDMFWHCPVGEGSCSYVINLCAPTDHNLRLIQALVPYEDIIHLLSKDWKCNDDQVMMIFYEMVNAHWEDHLKELDIKYVRRAAASTFEWIHPQRHKPWPPKKWKTMRARRQQLGFDVKQESPDF